MDHFAYRRLSHRSYGFLYLPHRPVYESTAMVLIDLKDNGGKVPFLDLTGAVATNKITNELETLKSRSMAEAVARTCWR